MYCPLNTIPLNDHVLKRIMYVIQCTYSYCGPEELMWYWNMLYFGMICDLKQ